MGFGLAELVRPVGKGFVGFLRGWKDLEVCHNHFPLGFRVWVQSTFNLEDQDSYAVMPTPN